MFTKSSIQKIIFLLYLVAVLGSLLICTVKFKSLGYHTRDYAFYLQFASKLFDQNSAKQYALNPDGENWLFMEGFDGTDNFLQSIHFEPIKYLYAVLYKLTQTPYALFALISLVFFFPVLYTALALPLETKPQMQTALSIGILYAIFPSALFVPSYDLRPYIFLAPFFFLSILSIQYSRPAKEQILWFNLLFMAREEALILGIVVLLYAFAKIQKQAIQKITFITLCTSYGIWAIATILFLRWSAYPILIEKLPFRIFNPFKKLGSPDAIMVLAGIMITFLGLSLLWYFWKKLKQLNYFQPTLEILAISTVFIPFGYEFFSGYDPDWINFIFFSSRYFLHYCALMLFFLIVLEHTPKQLPQKAWESFSAIIIIVIIFLNTQSSYNIISSYKSWLQITRSTQEIWFLKQDLEPYKSQVLVDYATYQAFYNLENVYVYNRLPWYLAQDKERYFPANREILEKLAKDKIEYIIVSTQSKKDIEELLTNGQSSKIIFENELFVGYKLSH